VTTFALGALGPSTFALGWWDSFLAILFFDIIGSLGPSLLITLGPKTGLRCMTLSRYAFGLIPGGFLAFVNVLTCIGWSMVNTMAGAEVFYALTDLKLPLAVCILILAIGYTPSHSRLISDLSSSVSSDTSGFTSTNVIRGW
jgi:purine-cytosine permease-like protein